MEKRAILEALGEERGVEKVAVGREDQVEGWAGWEERAGAPGERGEDLEEVSSTMLEGYLMYTRQGHWSRCMQLH